MNRAVSGFTLMEVLVALAVIGIGVIVVHEAFSVGLRTVDFVSKRTTGLMLLREKVQELSREQRQAGETITGAFTDPFDEYKWEATCESVPDEEYLLLTVTVNWNNGQRSVSEVRWVGSSQRG